MINTFRAALAVVLVGACLAAACSFNTADKPNDAAGHTLADGETLGKIDRLPGGTAVVTSVITLLDLTCADGQVIVKTNLTSIVGKMDCQQAVPQSTLERFYGQSVSITYAGGRLKIESVSAGSLDLPVEDATSRDVDATP